MSGVERVDDVVYGDDPALRLNLYRPATAVAPPVVLYVHGGGWRRGDRTTDVETRLLPIVESGIAVATLDYRLLPEGVFPLPVDDVRAALRWLRAHGDEHGLSGRIGVWGASAGAMLGTLAGLTAEPGGDDAVDAVVHWFGPAHFASTHTRSAMESRILPPATPDADLWAGLEGAALAEALRAGSPVEQVHPQAPPFLIVHGDRDRLAPVADAELLHDALARRGVDSTLVRLGLAGHEDAVFDSAFVLGTTSAFLRSALAG